MERSKEKHTLDAGYNGSETGSTDEQAADKGKRTGSNVSVDFYQKDEDGSSVAPEALLGHELFHSFDYQEGNMKGESKIPSSSKEPAEIRAVNFDNRIRNVKSDKKLRDSYGGQK